MECSVAEYSLNIKIFNQKMKINKCTTSHSIERNRRFLIAKNLCQGPKIFIQLFEVDRGHKNGPEIHALTDQGVIYIFNKNTGKLITCLIARPGQLLRYYKAVGLVCPKRVYKLAKKHQELKLNN